MTDKAAYRPLKDESWEAEEGGNSSTPPWARYRGEGWTKHRSLPWLRLGGEVVLVALVLLLSLKIMLGDDVRFVGRPPGPNDPKKDCMVAHQLKSHRTDLTCCSWVRR